MVTQIVGSAMKAENSFGRNGAQNASSDLPGKRTTSGMLPQGNVPADDLQTRKLTDENVPDHPFMKRQTK